MTTEPPTDEQLADRLDGIAREVNQLRRLIPHMSMRQLDSLSDSPFPADAADVLLDLDTWAVVAAANLRELGPADVIDLAG